jgi:UDP-GlcNAc:undecaprenyl-phosphate/decaprenyl-phosphate GlcNAc-1-phosphate transferase
VTIPTGLFLPVGAALGVVATWVSRAAARRLGVVSDPDPFVAGHTQPVALLGGVGIAAAAAAALALDSDRAGVGAAAVAGALLFLAVGLLDDVREQGPGTKLALQLAAASVAAALGARPGLTDDTVLDASFAVAWIVVVVNAVNVTDVCDGLVAGLAAIALCAFAASDSSLWALSLAICGACLGFLVFNAPPASVFLGDAGAGFLGFALASLSLSAVRAAGSGASAWAQAALMLGVPLFELAFIVLARRSRGVPWWRGSADHISLRLQAAGLSRWQTDVIAWTAAAALAAVGLMYAHLPPAARITLVAVVLGALAAASRALRQRSARTVPGARP